MIRTLPLLLPLAVSATVAPQDDEPYTPEIHDPTGEGEAHVAAMQVPDGFRIELWAEEPMLANPVCLYVSRTGDCYVGETFRHTHGVLDMREHRDWLELDIGATTVQDRVAMMRLAGDDAFAQWSREHDQVRRIRDTDGDGRADEATVFAGAFDGAAAGIGAGLLEHEGDVFWTCIPELWRLRDEDGDGVAEVRDALHTGYGVHVALLGHDLHGLRIGPDGRLYFSCGDRGFHVTTPDGVVRNTKSGAVLRCELDGSNLEIVHRGLRNPQELVFDRYGNLFTGDNNSDSIDRARWVQVLEGADSGWRYAFQWMEGDDGRGQRGSWNEEKLWFPHFPGQAAYLLPPIAWLASGPSGLAVDPGVGLPEAFADHFFLVDFRGSRTHSGVHAFDVTPKGAGFALGEVEPFVWNCLPVDGDFGPDGAYWFCDWVGGWQKTGRGRVYRMIHEHTAEAAADARRILKEGFRHREAVDLAPLLGHPHKDVRLLAQLELSKRGDHGILYLETAALVGATVEERLHGIWGMGIGARLHGWRVAHLSDIVEETGEVRVQAAKMLAEAGEAYPLERLARWNRDPDARFRYQVCGLIANRLAEASDESRDLLELIVTTLLEAGEADPVLRHGAIEALVRADHDLAHLARHESVDVRVARVVALRRRAERGDPGQVVALMGALRDADRRVALEASRALYEFGGQGGLTVLSEFLPDWNDDDLEGPIVEGPGRGYLTPFVRRYIAANERNGDPIAATAVANLVDRAGLEDSVRVQALRALGTWADPPNLDPIDGHFRDLPPREAEFVPELVQQLFDSGTAGWTDTVWAAWVETAATVGIPGAADRFERVVRTANAPVGARATALRELAATPTANLDATVEFALASGLPELSASALPILSSLDPAAARRIPLPLMRTGTIVEHRAALEALARMGGEWAEGILLFELHSLERGIDQPELRLDLIRAVESSPSPDLRERLEQLLDLRYEARQDWQAWQQEHLPTGATRKARLADPLARFHDSLQGGDAERGRQTFERSDLDCLRCHGGPDATGPRIGPDLTGIGARVTRANLLESIVLPNAAVHADFRNEAFFLTDETILVGREVGVTDGWLRILDAQGEVHEVHVDDVASRRQDLSAMPTDLASKISRREMRDLIAYLARR